MAVEYTPEEFADILLGVAADAVKETRQIVSKGSLNVKNDARRNVQQTAPVHNAHAQYDINYDIDEQGLTIVGDIGYDSGPGKAGNLGNLLEYGGRGDHSPPHRDLGRALDAEEPRFEEAMADMGERLLD